MSHPQVPRTLGIVDPLLGKELDGRYRVLEKVGEGAMSAVYLADQIDGGGRVAIKVLHDHLVRDADQKERFEREARALFGLEHPHILHVHDFGVFNGLPYLVMELLDGVTLDAYVEEAPPDPETGLAIARQVLDGLAFAHKQGVLHRDLKTENVFVSRAADGTQSIRLLDFGLVKFVDDDRWGSGGKALTAFGEVFGTPAYMSPEQATGSPVGAPSDVYSMGVVMFELLTGQWPFMEESRVDMFRAHLMKQVPRVADVRPDLEVRFELEQLLQRAMAKDPKQRFADAGAMLAALDAIPRPRTRLRSAAGAGAQPLGPPPPVPQALGTPAAGAHEPTWVPGAPLPGRRPIPRWLPIAIAGGTLAIVAIVVAVILLASLT